MKKKITDNLQRVKDNIAQACLRARRDPADVTLIAVTKAVDADTIRILLELGQLDLGESYVQNLLQHHARIDELSHRQHQLEPASAQSPLIMPRWHMLGHLQRNKVRQLLPISHLIHSVDSLRLAEEINTTAARLGLPEKVGILLQVNTSQEKQKRGLAVGAVAALAEQVATLPNLHIAGLMTMAPLTDDKNIHQFCFGRCRELFEEIKGERITGPQFQHLSMGMSQDYITAVEQGATMVRIGTALFE